MTRDPDSDEMLINDLKRELQELRAMVDLKDAKVHAKIDSIAKEIEHLQSRMKQYITIERYSPVEKIVVSGVGLILILVVTLIVRAALFTKGIS
jgi:hypothetical protein